MDEFAHSIALDGDTLVVGAINESSGAIGVDGNQSTNDVINSGAVYVFTRDATGQWAQQAYLKASNPEAGDRFGYSVDVSGDTLAVGAREESSAATGVNGDQSNNQAAGSGAVYVFARNNGVWSQQAYLKASNTDTSDAFGNPVALDGDNVSVTPIDNSKSARSMWGMSRTQIANMVDGVANEFSKTISFLNSSNRDCMSYLKLRYGRRKASSVWLSSIDTAKVRHRKCLSVN